MKHVSPLSPNEKQQIERQGTTTDSSTYSEIKPKINNSEKEGLGVKTIRTGLPPRPVRPSPGVHRGQYRQKKGIMKDETASVLNDIRGILKVKVVNKRANPLMDLASGFRLSTSSMSSNQCHDPRLNGRLSSFDQDLKYNRGHAASGFDDEVKSPPFEEKHFEIPIRGNDMGEFICIKL